MPNKIACQRVLKRMRTVTCALFAWSLLLSHATLSADETGGQPRLPAIQLQVGDKKLVVEVASSAEQRYNGLSFRTYLGPNDGMLFVYQQPRQLTFTMRNTLLPLSIAYIDENLVIDEILDMDVGPNQAFPSRGVVQYALEVNQGWFEQNGIKIGAQVRLQ